MKELSIEEKAKRYEEAIERARVWKEKSGMPADRQGILDDIFPELKVSEDEEVRKALYEYFKKLKDDGDIDETWYGFSYDKILAWLEKQGEEKSIWHNEDEVPLRGSLILLIMQSGTPIVAKIIEPNHIFNHGERWAYIDDLLEKQDSQNLANSAKTCKENTIVIIPKFRIGDEIKTSNEESLIITKIDEKGYWSEDLFICDFDEECLWDLVEQNHAWSEEDEEMCKEVLADIIYAKNDLKAKECLGLSKRAMKAFNWFSKRYKSLRPQNTWKPSKEQIESIRLARTFVTDDFDEHPTLSEILVELEKQLKKLREEDV